jgi:hypothetical protein
MENIEPRVCAHCGLKIPSSAKLTGKTSEGQDLCLACSIRYAQDTKGLKH